MLASHLSLLVYLTYQMFMFSNQVTSMKISLFAKHVAENIREKTFLMNIQRFVVKVKVSFSFYCFNFKFNNTAWLVGSLLAGRSYEILLSSY